MAKKQKQKQKQQPIRQDDKTEKLRVLRLAEEASRKEAGTWGDLAVGEIVHADSQSIYVQVWKGNRRPDPVQAKNARDACVPAAEWPTIAAWVKGSRADGFSQRVLGWNLSEDEAQKIKENRITERRAAGHKVINDA